VECPICAPSWENALPLHFDVVVGLLWSNDTQSYTGSSIATGRVTQAGQVKGNDPDKKGTTPPQKRICVQETSEMPWPRLTNR